MTRSHILLPAAVFALAVGVCARDAGAQTAPASASGLRAAERPSAMFPHAEAPLLRAAQISGRLEGVVIDAQGKPLAGVAVTAHGSRLKFAVTDREGRYRFDALPEGPYFVRAHLPGYVASRQELVDVRPAHAVSREIRLMRTGDTLPVRPLLTASMIDTGASADEPSTETDADTDHSHSATAWRLRHLRRSVLRDAGHGDGTLTGPADVVASAASPSLSFLTPGAFSAQVQLLTISAFDSPEELFTSERLPLGVAYVSLDVPAGPDSAFAVQGALTQGDMTSWVLGGSYSTVIAGTHATEVGMSYAAQRYEGGNPIALAAMGETSRTVAALHAFDTWQVSANHALAGGARFAHYGYIDSPGLFSPSIEWRWQPGRGQRLRAFVSQQVVAPGAEEFVPSRVEALWMPPQRTFSGLGNATSFRPERTRHFEVGFDQDVASFVFAARGFRQIVSDQIVTIFGLRQPEVQRTDLGHYYTGTAGQIEAFGWGLSMSRPVGSRLRGSVAYTVSHANWLTSPDAGLFTALARSAARAQSERIQDLTTSIETEIPETATHVVAVYKLNTGYARDEGLEADPALAGRFDVQVNQRLPFLPLGDTEWEVLVAVRNLFRDPLDGSSLYDELLVVRPPKRIMGGLMIRF